MCRSVVITKKKETQQDRHDARKSVHDHAADANADVPLVGRRKKASRVGKRKRGQINIYEFIMKGKNSHEKTF